MKVLYFLAHPECMGGAITVLMKQASIMQQHGYQVLVVIQNNEENNHIPEYEYMCELYHLENISAQYPIATCIENLDICSCMRAYESVKSIVESFMPDLIHSIQLNITVEYVSQEFGIPHLMNIYQISDGMFNIKWMNVFPRYQSGDSYFYCEKWQKGLGIESRCIRVPYIRKTNVDTEKKDLRQDKIEMVNIAVIAQHKGQLKIIKFVEKCKLNGIPVHIRFLGDDKSEYAIYCKEYVKEHGLTEEVSFEGLVKDVEKYLSISEIMIHASTSESYPGVIVEAMGNRVPVIATPVAGIPELLHDEENGFLTKGYTVDDIYIAFERYMLSKEENRIKGIIDRAYDTYLLNHTSEVSFQKLEEYYKDILQNYVRNENGFWEGRNSFDTVLRFGKTVNIGLYSEETKKALWFLFHIKQVIDEKSYETAVIWGAGFWGKIAMEWCRLLSLEVIGVIDKYKIGYFEGIEIRTPDIEMIKNTDILFLAMMDSGACEKNMKFIENAGRVRNVDYFLTCNNPCIQIK
ncbi:MAG: glycosyltransferase family 4 protein [Alphaproteobacteria bacterium]|nr:glycosyltransferase family 4 protein [Alphaproteobacteria bacterium]MBQ6888573.1 glycosyltransferase family 4 protein [Lachnospiraceae bacterium]